MSSVCNPVCVCGAECVSSGVLCQSEVSVTEALDGTATSTFSEQFFGERGYF